MKNDPGRHWTMLSPFVPGELLTAQAQQAESAGLAAVAAPEFYGNPLVPLAHCGAVTSRILLLSGITLPLVHNPFTLAMTAMDIDRLPAGGSCWGSARPPGRWWRDSTGFAAMTGRWPGCGRRSR